MRRGLLVVCFLLASAPAAQATTCTTCTWGGGGGSSSWSNGANWVGGNAPNNPITSLSFPSLGSCTGTTCYASNNDLGAIATTSLSIDDGSPYTISGNGIVIGSGGLQANTSSASVSAPTISAPVSLNAPQTWQINGGTGNTAGGLLLTGALGDAGPEALTIDASNGGLLGLAGGADVGPITVNGGTGGGIVGLGNGASLNGASGQTVSFGSGTSLIAPGGGSVGPLTLASASLQVGAPTTAGVLSDFSGASNSLDSGSTVTLSITQAGNVAGTAYSQFRAGGPIALGGATLHVTSPSPCPTLNVGDVLSLVATTAALSGTFSNLPNGSTVEPTCSGGTPATLRINYTANAVTATVVSGTSTALTVSPTGPVTNQTVTLAAKVNPSYGSAAPGGTVEFDNNGTAIGGCASVPVDSTGTATCLPAFSATSSPEGLTASFTPSSGSGFASSATSAATSLSVGKASTTAAVSLSSSTPATGQDVTYTATITPAYAGAALLTGDVQFVDNGSPITNCTDATQSADASGMTATCTTSYSSTGSHSITVSYPGDANFTSSKSSAQTVNVQSQSGNGNGSGSGNGNGTPKGKLVLAASKLTVSRGKVSVSLQCASRKACRGGFVITGRHLGKHPKSVVCAAASYRVAAGKTKLIAAKVSAVCLSGLKHAHGHQIHVRFSSGPRSGQAGISKLVVLAL